MDWTDELREGLDVALNEADMLGLRLGPSGRWCDLLIHVSALPMAGPLDPDARRILRLMAPTQVKVLLRTARWPSSDYGAPIPLAGLGAVEDFFASLEWSGQMYGWRFLDDPSLTRDWPDQVSLSIDLGHGVATHSLYWFNECGRGETSCHLEGSVTFQDLEVLRADETPIPLTEFIADGRRQWQAFTDHDDRLSAQAQLKATVGTPSWRPYARKPADGAAPG